MIVELGAAAAVADVVGFTVLSGLYVSHARQVKRLREWAGSAPEQATSVPRRRNLPRAGIRARHLAVAFGALLVLAFGLTRLTGGGAESGRLPSKPKRKTVEPVTVAVLNGTMVPHLAARLRDRIAAAGFKKSTIDDFSDKQLAESVVQYAPGHQAEAAAVGRTLGIARREPVTADGRALAPRAQVIVIAGADTAR